MIFGDRQSESPRVPSPWAKAQQLASSPRTNPIHSNASSSRGGSSSPSDSVVRKALHSDSLHHSPLSRAARRRGMDDSQTAQDSPTEIDDGHDDSLTSTPPTDEDEADGFFTLDADLDVLHLGSDAASCKGDAASEIAVQHVALPHPRVERRPTRLAPEPDLSGNLEYKLRILPPTRHRYDKLLTQLQWRLLQGGGECTYEIGVLDDGLCIGICSMEMRASLRVLASMATELGAAVQVNKAFSLLSATDRSALSTHSADDTSMRELRAMDDEQARLVLLSEPMAGRGLPCSCGLTESAVSDTIAYIPRPGSSSEWTSLENESLSSGITIDMQAAAMPGDNGGPFLVRQSADDDDHFSSEAEDEQDAVDGQGRLTELVGTSDDDEHGLTFSLSLDERATRSGFGFRRAGQRRACRFNDVSRKQRAATVAGTSAIDGALEAEEADSSAQHRPCLRLIVEATVARTNIGTESFIDYSSL